MLRTNSRATQARREQRLRRRGTALLARPRASGTRRFLDDPAFAAWSITDNVTSAFPPTLVTAGNADPLRQHSELLAEKLRAQGVETDTVFYPDDHQPPLGHEYQFDLDTDAGQQFLERLLTFLRQRFSAPTRL